jgi:transcriptional regulator with XRE-family HTH domain
MMIRPVHLRMARAALGWSLKDLAERADVNINTISRYEAGSQVMSGTIAKLEYY